MGLTKDLEDRLNRHNKGWERTTRAYAPFKLIYSEDCEDRKNARLREKYLKSGIGKEFLKNLNKN